MILLTGATGYLGSHLLRLLLKRDESVLILKRSHSFAGRIEKYLDQVEVVNSDQIDVADIFRTFPVSRIIHTATTYGRNGESLAQIVNTNLVLPLELAYYGAEYNIQAFYNISTTLPENVNAYARSKKQLEPWLRSFSRDDYKVINLLPEYFYGPGDGEDKFITMLINKMRAKEKSIPLSPCTQKRDFFYIDDFVTAFDKIYRQEDHLADYTEFGIGSGEAVALKDLVIKIAELCHYPYDQLNFGAFPLRENEVNYSKANIDALREIGWKPAFSLEAGLEKVCNTFDYGI